MTWLVSICYFNEVEFIIKSSKDQLLSVFCLFLCEDGKTQ